MRGYIASSGTVFALTFAAHVARLYAEGSWLLRDPFFIATSLAALALAVWALVLLVRPSR